MSDAGRSGSPRDAADDGVPEALRARVREVLGANAAQPTPASCLAAGERLLAHILRADEGSRATALDLLTADALVTHAFELAADDPARIDAMAAAAMQRIAAAAAGATGR